MKAYTLGNTILTLEEPPLNSGGEGSVYKISGYPKKVAKIYHDSSMAGEREAKIKEMVRISDKREFQRENIAEDVAWPLAPLYDDENHFIGFGMNRMAAKNELDNLYEYPPRNAAVATMEKKVDCLISLCEIIERLHSAGQVFGDFNPNNIKINDDWTVKLVDADSCHVNNEGRRFRCTVCMPGYVAPEVVKACRGSTYADCPGETFTQESDCFALAVHIFRMLMNGAHPYYGKRQRTGSGSTPAPKPIDKRVEKGETPYFSNIPGVTVPEYAPDLNAFPPYMRVFFEAAFVLGAHVDPTVRPTAKQWKRALIRYKSELKRCKSNKAHYYWSGAYSCPYCEADARYQQTLGRFGNGSAHIGNQKNNGQTNKKTNVVAAPAPAPATAQAVVSPKTSPKTPVKTPFAPVKTASATSTGRSVTTGKKKQTAASVLQKSSPQVNSKRSKDTVHFYEMIVGTCLMFCIQMFFWNFGIYNAIFGSGLPILSGMLVSIFAGIFGVIAYNIIWPLGRSYAWWDYVCSILVGLGFAIGYEYVFWLSCTAGMPLRG